MICITISSTMLADIARTLIPSSRPSTNRPAMSQMPPGT